MNFYMDYQQLYENGFGTYFFVPIVDLGHVELVYFSRKARQKKIQEAQERNDLREQLYKLQGGNAKVFKQELKNRGVTELKQLLEETG